MQRLLEHAFDIRPHERRVALLLFAFFAGVGMFYTLGAAVGDTLFLSHLPPHAVPATLPWVYVGIAVANVASMLAFDAVQRRVTRRASILGTQVLLAAGVLLARQLVEAGETSVYFALVVGLEACALFSITLFFSFAGDYFAPRDARRLYGFIVGGMPLGTVIAGYAIRVSVEHVGAKNLLYAAACVLLVNAGLAAAIFRVGRPLPPEPFETESVRDQVSLRALASRPYVRQLAALTLLSVITYVTVDYQMKWLASELREEALARFFGAFYGWVGVAQLLFQVLLSQRMLQRLGIISSLTVLPLLIGAASALSYVGGYVGYFGLGALTFAAGINFLRVTLAETLDLPSRELLYLPLPARMRQRLQPLLSGALAPLAQGLGGLLMLLALAAGLGGNALSLLVALAAMTLVLLLTRLRPGYRATLASTLRDHELDATDLERVMQGPTAERLIEALLRSADAEVVKGTIGLLEGRELGATSRVLLELVSAERDEVAVAALDRLVAARDEHAQPAIERAWQSPRLPLRQAAVLALCELAGRDAISRVSSALSTDDLALRSSAVVGLARFCGPAGQELVRPELAGQACSDDPELRIEAARTLGRIAATGFADLWTALLEDADERVGKAALDACAPVGDERLLPALLDGIAHPERRAACVRALCAMPRAAVAHLGAALADGERAAAERCAVAEALGEIGGGEAAAALWAHTAPELDLTLRLASARALRVLRSREAGASAELAGYDELLEQACAGIVLLRRAIGELADRDPLVTGIFGDHAQLNLQLLCALLALRYEGKTIDRIRYNLLEEPREVGLRALELIDELLPRKLATHVVAAAQAWLDPPAPAPELHADTRARLMEADPWLRVATVHHLNQGAAYPTLAAGALSDEDRALYRLLDVVSFLKRVPLLAGLPAYYLREQAEVAEFRVMRGGDRLFAQGDVGDALYIICQGEIEVRRGDDAIARLSAPSCFGELALLDGEPRSASAFAVENDTLLLRLAVERFRALLYSQPSTIRALLRTLDRRIRETQSGGQLSERPPAAGRRSVLMRAQKLGLTELVSTMSFLQGVELFQDLSSAELANLAGIAQQALLYDGDRLFEEGDPGECLYLVCSGRLRISVADRQVAVLERNACVGEMAVISGLKRSATATAIDECRLLRVGADDLNNLLAREPSIGMGLLRTLAKRLRDALALRPSV